MTKVYNNIADLIKILMNEKRMSLTELSEYVGVQRCVVNNWKMGRCYAKQEHYDKVSNMVLILSGYDVRYRRQALDILKENQ